MTAMSAHEDIQELLGAFALDALDPPERAQVEEHLKHCAECRREVEEHRDVAAMFFEETVEPRPDVWQHIVERLDQPAPTLARERRSISLRTVVSLAAAAVIVIAGLGIAVVALDQRTSGPSTSQAALQRAAQTALTAPGARRTTLRSSDGRLSIEVVILPTGRGYLVGNNLPALPNGQTYQLWAETNNQLISFGLLGQTPGVSSFQVEPPVVALAVTDERAGGVPAPTKAPLVSGSVPPEAR
jgi:anti-sigma-K factor RskA